MIYRDHYIEGILVLQVLGWFCWRYYYFGHIICTTNFQTIYLLQLIYFATHIILTTPYFSSLILGYYLYNNAFIGAGIGGLYYFGLLGYQQTKITIHTKTQIIHK